MNKLRIWVAKPEQGTKPSCKRARNRGIGAGLGSKSCQFSQKRKLRLACLLAITWDLIYPSHLHARTIRPNEVESPQSRSQALYSTAKVCYWSVMIEYRRAMVFEALSHPTRIKIMRLVQEKPR